MKKIKTIWLWLVFFLMLTYPIKSQSQTEELDLPGLMKLALQQNADVRVQSAKNRIAKWRKWQSIANWLPRISADASYIQSSGENDMPNFVSANGIIERTAMFQVQQHLFDASTWADLKESSVSKRQQQFNFFSTRQQVLYQVIRTYFDALKAKGEIKIFQDNLNAFKLLYEQSQMLYRNGVVPEIDVKKSQVEFLLQKNSLIRAKKNYQDLLNKLKELVNYSMDKTLMIQNFQYHKINLDSLNYYAQFALENNPQLKVLKLEVSRYRIRQTAAVLQHLPAANISALYGWDTNEPLRQYNRGWQLWLNVSLPLWQWGTTYADGQIAALRYNQTEQQLQKLEKQIMQQVNAAFHECEIQQQQMQAMQESKAQAEQAVQMARIGYQEGTLTNLDLINTQKLLTETNINYLRALYDFYVAKARLYLMMGKLKEDLAWLEN